MDKSRMGAAREPGAERNEWVFPMNGSSVEGCFGAPGVSACLRRKSLELPLVESSVSEGVNGGLQGPPGTSLSGGDGRFGLSTWPKFGFLVE